MKFVSYSVQGGYRAALFTGAAYLDVADSARLIKESLPEKMEDLLKEWNHTLAVCSKILTLYNSAPVSFSTVSIHQPLLAPVPHPASCRDGYAFRQHVAAARRNRGVDMIPEFDEYPVFYFTNHQAVFGEGDILCEADHFKGLDFELEVAVVIGKSGRNIPSAQADQHIAGFMVMNDISARVLQMEEMKLNLGPAKGKDFATTFGPWLVTPDELHHRRIDTPFGINYNLAMSAWHNGVKISAGNMKDMNWTFAELIERASYGVTLQPGDVIGSGTVGTGCYLELNGTRALEAKTKGEQYTPVWFAEGDVIELEIELLGKLSNRFIKAPGHYSILEKKKQQPG